MSERMYHPCHKLSVPSAKLFWCRHCMQMFENAIARWKHSKKCHAIPGYKPKDHEARVVQLYVKPDKVSYTSNIIPGQTVYHKPHVKKVSTDLKCVICDTKFDSLYDMRNHVKEPCQRSDIKSQSVASTQFKLSDKLDQSETLSSLKIRRVENEEEGVLSQNTALSVLAEASKHVESLSNGDIIIEQVIEEEVPQIDDNCAHVSNLVEDSSSVAVFQDSVTFEDKLAQEVIVAYPRPIVKPELGIVAVSFQSADGQQIQQDNLDLQTIQECLRETALGSTVGQVIEVGNQGKVYQYVVGFQGVVWPLDENQVPHLNAKDSTENAALFQTEPPPLLRQATLNTEPSSVDFNSVSDSLGIDITSHIQAGIFASTSEQKTITPQALIRNTAAKTDPSFSEPVETSYHPYLLEVANDTQSDILQTTNTVTIENQSSSSSNITELKPAIIDTKPLNIEPNSASLIEVLLKSGAIVPQADINNSVSKTFNEVYTLATTTSQSQQTIVRDVITMASGKQLADNLFGFAELTGDLLDTPSNDDDILQSNDTSKENPPTNHVANTDVGVKKVDIGLVKRDEHEIIVPILNEKSGVKKFKVLARQMVEDDEDIRKPESSERESPNTTEQTKENINTGNKLEKKTVQKVTDVKTVNKSNIRSPTENKETGVKSIKQFKTIPAQCNKQLGNTKDNVEKVLVKKKVVKKKVKLKQDVVNDNKEGNSRNELVKDRSVEKSVEDAQGCHEHVKDKSVKDSHSSHKHNHEIDKNVAKFVKDTHDSHKHEKVKSMKDRQDSHKHAKDKNVVKHEKDKPNSHEHVKDKNALKRDKEDNVKSKNVTKGEKDKKACSKLDIDVNVNIVKVDTKKTIVSTKDSIPNSASKDIEKYKSLQDTVKTTESTVTNASEIDTSHIKSVECRVKLKRDPSIENLCKLNLDDSSGGSVESSVNSNDLSDTPNNSTSSENSSFSRPSSSEESRQKTADMVFNANVPVRKSGRLQSAKCASRYRGDYGIRVDTYKQLVSKKEAPLNEDSGESQFDEEAMDSENYRNMKSDVAAVVEECVLNASKAVELTNIESVQQCVDSSNTCECTCKRNFDSESGMDNTKNDNCIHQKNCKTCKDGQLEKHKSNLMNCNKNCSSCAHCENRTSKFNHKEYHSLTFSETLTKNVPFTNTTGNDGSVYNCDAESICCNRDFIGKSDKSMNLENNDLESFSLRKEAACGPEYPQGELIAKEIIAEKVLSLHCLEKDSDEQFSEYVHSVGKSVKRKRLEIKKYVNLTQSDNVPVLESSPVKDPIAGLENLRLKLFEKAGADLIKADNAPKQFESALISSKRRVCNKVSDGELCNMVVNSDNECAVSKDEETLSIRSGKSTRVDNNQQILQEVAQSLDILKKVKRKAEPFKRKKFEDKQFMLRSMARNHDDNSNEEVCSESDHTEPNEKEVVKQSAKVSSKRSSSRNSVESVSSVTSCESNMESISSKTSHKKPAAKPKSIICSACGHSFKSKELMKKHFPCRVRQTRTWSQNKLRPNRAVKRVENCPKKFVCQLPKSGKGDANKNRPQLLTYRKTKFRRVKGKRRRKLYILLQDLKHKRKLVKWPHLGVVYDDLSFKEQCMYKLGLHCTGHASIGLEQYSDEDMSLFEAHRSKQKLISQLTIDFQHSLLVNSTENSTEDNKQTQSDLSDTSHSNVINSSQDSFCIDASSSVTDNSLTSESLVSDATLENKEMILEELEPTTDMLPERLEQKEMHELSSCGLDGYETVSSNKPMEDDIAVIINDNKSEVPSAIITNIEEVKDDKLVDLKAINEDKEEQKIELDTNNIIHMNTDISSPENSRNVDSENSTEPDYVTMEESESENAERELPQKSTTQSAELSEEDSVENFEYQPQNKTECTGTDESQGMHLDVNVSTEMEKYETMETDESNLMNDNKSVEIHCSDCAHEKVTSENQELLNNFEVSEETDQSGLGNEMINDDKCENIETVKPVNTTNSQNHQEDKQVNDKINLEKNIPCPKESPVKSEMMISINRKKSKYAVSLATDIEFYHQTASIDKDSLVSDKSDHVTVADLKQYSNVNPDLIQHASELLQDILGDVEQAVNDKPVCIGHEPKLDVNNTSTPIRSPLKSPVKNGDIQALREIDLISPIKANVIKDTDKDEKLSPSSGKKKIDFKTYASRKALMHAKECEENEKEIHRNLCDSKDLTEDFFDRLIDAVSVIDSIIEEQKDHSFKIGSLAGFSAITPELACELAATKVQLDHKVTDDENKPYDIESLPYDQTNIHDNDKIEETAIKSSELNSDVITDDQDTIKTNDSEGVNRVNSSDSQSTLEIGSNMDADAESHSTIEVSVDADAENNIDVECTKDSSEYIDDDNVPIDELSSDQKESNQNETISLQPHHCKEVKHNEDVEYVEICSDTFVGSENIIEDVMVENVDTISDLKGDKESSVSFGYGCNETIADSQDDLSYDSMTKNAENIDKSDNHNSVLDADITSDKADNDCILNEYSMSGSPLQDKNTSDRMSDIDVPLDNEIMFDKQSVDDDSEDEESLGHVDILLDEDYTEEKLIDEHSADSKIEIKHNAVDLNSEQEEKILDEPSEAGDIEVHADVVEEESVDVDFMEDDISKDNIAANEEHNQETERLEQHFADEPSACEMVLDNTSEERSCTIEDLHNVTSCESSEISSTEIKENESENTAQIDHDVNTDTILFSESLSYNESNDRLVENETSDNLMNQSSADVQNNEALSIQKVEICDASYMKDDLSDSLMDSNSVSNDNLVPESSDAVKKVSIKESNRDFTIKYEMNGLVIKENLLTGDKNVVENSSPFRSTSESQSTGEHVSELGSDTSLISKPLNYLNNSVLDTSNIDSNASSIINSNSELEPADEQPESINYTDHKSCSSSDDICGRIDIEKTLEVSIVSESSVDETSLYNDDSSVCQLSDLPSDDDDIDLPDINHIPDAKSPENSINEEPVEEQDVINNSDLDNLAPCDSKVENELSIALEMGINSDQSADKLSTWSPPTLEKENECDTSTDESIEIPEIVTCLSTEGSPPVLAPENIDEDEISYDKPYSPCDVLFEKSSNMDSVSISYESTDDVVPLENNSKENFGLFENDNTNEIVSFENESTEDIVQLENNSMAKIELIENDNTNDIVPFENERSEVIVPNYDSFTKTAEPFANGSMDDFDSFENDNTNTAKSYDNANNVFPHENESTMVHKNGSTNEIVPERHFLDALGNAFTEPEVAISIPDKLEDKFIALNDDKSVFTNVTTESEIKYETEQFEDSIGRHFSDAIAEPVEESLTLQSLLDKSENGEVTLAQIKQILSPVQNRSFNSSIPEQSLLKIKSSIANLLSKVKKPTKKDPSWLKRDFLTNYKPRTKMHDLEDSSYFQNNEDNSNILENDQAENLHISDGRDSMCIDNVENDENSSKGSVTDNILQMLTSLEDKGSLAGNMTNLLDILAENLGFLGRKDSDKEAPKETNLKFGSNSDMFGDSIRTQKELIAEYLEEGDQPPPVDDIPMADDEFEFTQIKEKEELLSTNLLHSECDNTASSDAISDNHDEITNVISKEDGIEHLSDQCSDGELETSNRDADAENIDLKFDKPEEIGLVSDSVAKPKVKARTIFKSITELNSIETDEESNSGDMFDPISLSAGLSKLNDKPAWEFNSDYSSDGDNEIDEECDVEPANVIRSTENPKTFENSCSDNVVCNIEDSAAELNAEENKGEESDSYSNHANSDTETEEVYQSCGKSRVELLNNKVEPDNNHTLVHNDIFDYANTEDKTHNIEDKDFSCDKKNDVLSTSTSTKICNNSSDMIECLDSDADVIDDHQELKTISHNKLDHLESNLESIDSNDVEECSNAEVSCPKDLVDDCSFNYSDTSTKSQPYQLVSDNSLKLSNTADKNENKCLFDEDEDSNSTQVFAEQDDIDDYTSDIEPKDDILNTGIAPIDGEAIENNKEASKHSVDLQEEKSNHEIEFHKEDLNPITKIHNDEKSNNEIDINEEQSLDVELNKEEAVDKAEPKDNELNTESMKGQLPENYFDTNELTSLECNDSSNLPNAQEATKVENVKEDSTNISVAVESKAEENSVFRELGNEDYSMTFCETIAEKVKRKQRARCKSVCYSYNPLLYYSSAYAKAQKPAKKELSVFRSSILEKRAREKYAGKEDNDDYDCSARKKRFSSVPKDMYSNEKNDLVKDTVNSLISRNCPDVKPCYVTLARLSDDVIEKYANRKRKLVEEVKEEESRPPIKVTIKLSQIVYPPNSPYGSTSVSSCRSGYESECSENSDSGEDSTITSDERNSSELSHSSENTPHATSDTSAGPTDNKISEDVTEREPLKIKMRTLLTKINDNNNAQKFDTFRHKELISEDETISKISSESDSLEFDIKACRDNLTSEASTDKKEIKNNSDDVMFYLSDDSSSEQDSIKGQIREIVEKSMYEDSDSVQKSVDKFIPEKCGESNVDLSASDSDSDEEINADLNADVNVGKKDLATLKNDIPKKSDMTKHSIVSDLKLSDSESDDDRFEPFNAALSNTTDTVGDKPFSVSGISEASKENDNFEIVKNNGSVLKASTEPVAESDIKDKADLDDLVNLECLPIEHNQDVSCSYQCDNLSGTINSDRDRLQQLTNSLNSNKSDFGQLDLPVGSSTNIQEVHEHVENQIKVSDSEFAVKSLENESFQRTKDIMGEQCNDMMYYAVEVSDDFETNEAVENLESVELEQGEVVTNECESAVNIIDAIEARVRHSQVNDALDFGETVNEEIVENCSEHRIIDSLEPKIHKADYDKPSGTQVYYPTVNEVQSKYLYGINEDSQSSNEIVEELVMDTIENNTCPVEQLDQMIVENDDIEFMDVSDIVNRDNESMHAVNEQYMPPIQSDDMHVDSDKVFTDIVNTNIEEVSNPMYSYL